MAVDLHVHSIVSDGSDTPSQLLTLAAGRGITTLALTDHDTQEGIAEARQAAERNGVTLIPGVELSVEFDGGMHLVVLWLEPGDGPLQDRLTELRMQRDERNTGILECLRLHGMDITAVELAARAGKGSAGRPHIAALMMDKEYVPDIASAFDLWLSRGRPAYVPRVKLNAETAIGLALESGGVPILAHPHTLGINRAEPMSRLLDELKGQGLVGIEAIYSSYHRHEREGYTDLARRFGLIPSGGSDYHGAYKPGLELGVGYGDLHVAESVVEELKAHARS
jgi:predicted metal-dependent phosphoesterase TrpH